MCAWYRAPPHVEGVEVIRLEALAEANHHLGPLAPAQLGNKAEPATITAQREVLGFGIQLRLVAVELGPRQPVLRPDGQREQAQL